MFLNLGYQILRIGSLQIIIGSWAVNIRHSLTEHLFNAGGHIGYGIRPSERRKGYATKLLALSLEKAKELNITKALVVCDEVNTASEKQFYITAAFVMMISLRKTEM